MVAMLLGTVAGSCHHCIGAGYRHRHCRLVDNVGGGGRVNDAGGGQCRRHHLSLGSSSSLMVVVVSMSLVVAVGEVHSEVVNTIRKYW